MFFFFFWFYFFAGFRQVVRRISAYISANDIIKLFPGSYIRLCVYRVMMHLGNLERTKESAQEAYYSLVLFPLTMSIITQYTYVKA